MRYTLCTIVDRGYLYRGLALYQSLVDHCAEFTLWVLCMDDVAYSLLERMRLDNVRLIKLEELEDDDLRKAGQGRSMLEYCCTCKAPWVLHVMENDPGATHVMYVDGDIMFFGEPQPVYDELGENSVLVFPHRYAPEYRASEAVSGPYNAGQLVFRNDANAVECLTWWRERCLEACRRDSAQGLCLDQKYLDDWPSRFKNVGVSRNNGAALAPWNLGSHQISSRDGTVFVDSDPLIFYHFHSLQVGAQLVLSRRPMVASKGYRLNRSHMSMIYASYGRAVRRAIGQVQNVAPDFADGYAELGLRELASAFLRRSLLLV